MQMNRNFLSHCRTDGVLFALGWIWRVSPSRQTKYGGTQHGKKKKMRVIPSEKGGRGGGVKVTLGKKRRTDLGQIVERKPNQLRGRKMGLGNAG
jgi:hypothetical protein